jgi:hypothetical protein
MCNFKNIPKVTPLDTRYKGEGGERREREEGRGMGGQGGMEVKLSCVQ